MGRPRCQRFSPASALMLLALCLSPPALAEEPRRIVSLDLCTDWMLLSHARPGQVAAYSPYLYQFDNDRFEPGLPTHDGSLEQVLALKPDLVISGEFNALLLRQRLRQLGHNVQVLANPRRLDDIPGYIQQLRRLVSGSGLRGRQAGGPVTRYPARHQRLLMLGANGIGAGHDTLEHDIIRAAGWRNYIDDSGFVALDLERVIADPPDAVFISVAGGRSLAAAFASHPAVSKRVSASQRSSNDNWRWTCPGPWSYDLIEELSRWNVD